MNRNPKEGPQSQLPVVDQLIDYSAVIFEPQRLETIKTKKVKLRWCKRLINYDLITKLTY